jgi:hypothetical protein
MCDKCDEIETALERYRRLKGQINDQQMLDSATRLIAELEADKIALHPGD